MSKNFADVENNPNFQTAKQLLNRGFTVTNWGAMLTDTDEEIYVYKHGIEIAYFADGTNRSTEEAFEKVGLPAENWKNNNEVMHFLSELTEGGGRTGPG